MSQTRYEDHTDNVQEKLRLLQAAHEAGNYDVAMSLAESIKDTLTFERQTKADQPKPQLAADAFASVKDLPGPWAKWAQGWRYCKTIALFETVGIARSREPVEVSVAFRADQTTDLHREVRERYAALDIPPYSGFINPRLVPVEQNGEIVDVRVEYPDDFTAQMLEYAERYSFLPTWNF